MFPLYDSTRQERFPFVNYLLIAANVIVFLRLLLIPNIDPIVNQYAFIPENFNFFDPLTYVSIFTSLFMHGGFLHIISNMMFLHIFGDNIEDALGHFGYIIFYFIAGFIATMSQYFIDPNSSIPMIGASGAISAVAGMYFVLFRKATIKTLVFLFIFVTVIDLPASFVLGYWFVSQVFSSIGMITSQQLQHGGIAFFAHIGGFLFGYWAGLRKQENSLV